MHALYDVPAPAKLNLFLHITGRRADGYHLLQSVFMLIDWQDTLHFEATQSADILRTDLNRSSPALPAQDLCVRAALALQAATGCERGAHISVDKQIPAQAGMGGGSSDAASTLIALNRLWNLGLTRAQLARIGLSLGADVPFFVHGHNAWVEGIGESITALSGAAALPSAHFTVIKPEAGLDTGRIFTSCDLQRSTERATIGVFAADHYGFGHNDLQPVAEALCADVKKARNLLEAHGSHARMTGSGSAVFAKTSQDFVLKDAPSNWISKNCKNLDQHPLHSWMLD